MASPSAFEELRGSCKRKQRGIRINMELPSTVFILMFNSTKPQQHHTPFDFAPNKLPRQPPQPHTKAFLRTPSGNINPLTLPSKPRGTSIGKHWEDRAYDSARDAKLTHSQCFHQSSSAKELPSPNGKYPASNTSFKVFKRAESKNEEDRQRFNPNEIPVLNFSKTPKSYKTQKAPSETLEFSQSRTTRYKRTQQVNQQKSTENSDTSNASGQKQPLTPLISSTLLKFKSSSKLSLSQLIDKETCEVDAFQIPTKQATYSRRSSVCSDEKGQAGNISSRGEGLPTHSVTRQIAGGTFSNSYPTNNPFLKFKTSEKTNLNKSKIFSSQALSYSSTGCDSKRQLHSDRQVSQRRRKQIQKGDFQIGKRLGKGKYGDVYLARHRELGFICAIKIIEKDLVRRQNVENQICRQMKISQYINHPNVTTLYGYFDDERNVYLLLQLCSEGNLFQVLKQRKRLPQKQAVTVISQLCRGVEYLHSENIIHRDIKPENIIIQNGQLKLCDFGWAVYCHDRLRSTFCGTPLYVSPEVLKGDNYDEKIDIWAIGILTYELLIGRVPFRINTQADMAKIIHEQVVFPEYVEVSETAKDFILRILNRQPEDRVDIEQVLDHPFLNQECPTHFLRQ